ncbi:hypothetical protein CEUSTIGMA_g6061.t1 [Chlamydomonas eustigma]|uniref:Sigma 54 modulation/S30EA ribosomal protein C-terminal domain-containing protein n=1 Tax=Chlamydomonas eustigma TaxID=1157962 RepID=A0A250X6W0_9CHLO|nr:hypothetical protein CEUSTIGMA_g6061.t1 [Chlamydomonas eustigma]|eukprot:GAX78622.1 hypothetical protein CEUSTIGMA_g6061.t1 [Chlamydomonas eustigma]
MKSSVCAGATKSSLRLSALRPVCISRKVANMREFPTRPQNSRTFAVSVMNKVAAPASSNSAKAVKVVLQGRHLKVTEAIKLYVENKVAKACEHYNHIIKEVDVTLSARGGDTGSHGKKEQRVEVTIYTVKNGVVRVEEAEEILYAAIDLVCDKIDRKLAKVKALAVARGTWPGRAGPHAGKLEEKEFEEYRQEVLYETQVFEESEAMNKQFAKLNKEFPAEVRRTKKIALDLMTVDEAIDAMEAVGHDFFVFREMESGATQIIYRRQAEGYGILVPENRD